MPDYADGLVIVFQSEKDLAGVHKMTRVFKITFISLLCFYALNLFAADENTMEDCASSGELNFICGVNAPEDLVIIPGTDWVVAGVMTTEDTTGLYLVDSISKEVSQLYSPQEGRNRLDRNLYGACPSTPNFDNFSTHGLAIQTDENSNGIYSLYTVSHGEREAIDVFELDASSDTPEITWVGCVLMPEGLDANDVSAMRDGTILATVLIHPGFSFDDLFLGRPIGGVYKWTPGSEGFILLEGSQFAGNNGIQVSSDETEIFVAVSGASAIFTIANSNPTQVLRRTRTMGFGPDNIVYDSNGYLLTAGMRNDAPACAGQSPLSGCPRGSIVSYIHPETMVDTVIVNVPANPDFIGATMGIIPGGREVWIGSFTSPRIEYQFLNIFI